MAYVFFDTYDIVFKKLRSTKTSLDFKSPLWTILLKLWPCLPEAIAKGRDKYLDATYTVGVITCPCLWYLLLSQNCGLRLANIQYIAWVMHTGGALLLFLIYTSYPIRNDSQILRLLITYDCSSVRGGVIYIYIWKYMASCIIYNQQELIIYPH